MYKLNEVRNRGILVIDDNDAIHEDFRKILTDRASRSAVNDSGAAFFGEQLAANELTFEMDSAFQGREGLEKVSQAIQDGRPYAMAFVDVRMPPGWNGIETIGHLWKVDPDLLVVICTAYNDYNWSEMEDQLGSMDRWLILKKPFDNVEVRQLAASLTEKWNLTQQARLKMSEVEQIVEVRTAKLQREIAERKKCEQKLSDAKDALQYQATHDFVTGLWNRASIYEALEKEFARSQRQGVPFGIALADIDYFKRVNDGYGHQAGDVVLRDVAERLQTSVRPYDLVGRYGGEEFLIVLPGCRLPEAFAVAERARDQMLRAPFGIGDESLMITVSIGVTTSEDDETVDLDSLIQRADSALYEAKRAGRNCVVQSINPGQSLPHGNRTLVSGLVSGLHGSS